MYYDPKLDQSKKFGWKKVFEESPPTEEEQEKWSKISLVLSFILGLQVILLGS